MAYRSRVALSSLSVLILTGTLLSGCFTEETTTSGSVCPEDGCRGGSADDDTGCVSGAVKDEDFAPLVGAEVMLRLPPDLEYAQTTDDTGSYSFCKLAPGVYTVFVSAEGHEAATRSVEVEASKVAPADILLTKLPPAAEAYMTEPIELTGFLDCSVAVGEAIHSDVCTKARDSVRVADQYPLRDDNVRSEFRVPLHEGVCGFAMHFDAAPPPPSSYPPTGMVYTVRWINPPVLYPHALTGPDGVEKVVTLDTCTDRSHGFPDVKAGNGNETDPAHIVVETAGNGDVQFTYGQKFTVWLVLFYNGFPVPTDFSAKPDG